MKIKQLMNILNQLDGELIIKLRETNTFTIYNIENVAIYPNNDQFDLEVTLDFDDKT